jgi:hypothetical protein
VRVSVENRSVIFDNKALYFYFRFRLWRKSAVTAFRALFRRLPLACGTLIAAGALAVGLADALALLLLEGAVLRAAAPTALRDIPIRFCMT